MNCKKALGKMNKAAFEGFLKTVLDNLAAVSIYGAMHYICMEWRHMGRFLLRAILPARNLNIPASRPRTTAG